MRAPPAVIALWLPAAPASAQAQLGAGGPDAAVPQFSAVLHQAPGASDRLAPERAAIRAAARRSRWVEGAVVGGVAFAAAGGFLAVGFCGADDRHRAPPATGVPGRSCSVGWRAPRSAA